MPEVEGDGGASMTVEVLDGDCRSILPMREAGVAQCCVTSPPYYGLRDYGLPASTWPDGWVGCLGLEPSPEMYVGHVRDVFREVRRALADDGTLWLNLGDSYCGVRGNTANAPGYDGKAAKGGASLDYAQRGKRPAGDMKQKDLIGIPWMVAFALRADGWYLRSDIIWSKPNPMPESVTDRPTKAHEYLFLLTKSERYYYDAAAIAEPSAGWRGSEFHDGKNAIIHPTVGKKRHTTRPGVDTKGGNQGNGQMTYPLDRRNKRTVWTVGSQPFIGAHFATFPPALIEPCILAGSRPGDTVLDPFGGAGTTGLVASRLSRNATLIELNPAYATMSRERITNDAPLLAEVIA